MSALDPYSDDEIAGLYDLDHAPLEEDLALYEQFARRGETPCLELGVGTGRVALPLVGQGIRVVGLDASPFMLARLRSSLDADAASRMRLVDGDMRDFDLGERFDLVYCALNTFEHLLSTEDQLATLRCVARHLTPGGLFVFQLRPLTAIDWTEPQTPLQLDWLRLDPRTGEPITKLASRSVAAARQLVIDTLIFDRTTADGSVRRRVLEVTLRLTGRFEMELLLTAAGLRLAALYGDSDLSPFDDASDTMIVVAEQEGA